MKNRFLAFGLCLLMLFMPIGCGQSAPDTSENHQDTSDVNGEHTVNFYVDGVLYETRILKSGDRVYAPPPPEKENYIFMGWYVNETFDVSFDFSSSVYHPLSLYAKFKIDAAALTNKITADTMRSIVTVRVERYKHVKIFGWDTGIKKNSETRSWHGSGVVVNLSDGYAYVLTNCHVAYLKDGFDSQKIWIEDYKGNKFEAGIYSNQNKQGKAISSEYDLAFLYANIKEESHEFKALPLADKEAELRDSVISVGTPDGQKNAIGFGEVLTFQTITLDNTPSKESNVTFPVLTHNAYTLPGSSGGAILNADLELVGIHYAGRTGDAYYGYAIPLPKIREFLNKYVYN